MMIRAPLLVVALLPALALFLPTGAANAQEASAEVMATATLTMPAVEITVNDLDFGELDPGEPREVLPDPAGDARGHFEIENVAHMGDDVSIMFPALPTSLNHTSITGQSLPLEWTGDHAFMCWRPHNQPAQVECVTDSWNPEDDEVVMVGTRTQGRGTRAVIDVYLGGKVVPTGEEAAGTYRATIQLQVVNLSN